MNNLYNDFYNGFVDKSIPLIWAEALLRRPHMYSEEIFAFMKDKKIETMPDSQLHELAALLAKEREAIMDEILVYYTGSGRMITGKTLRQLIAMGYKI